jgi:hypothetical protein
MTEPVHTSPAPGIETEGPESSRMPIATMVGSALIFLLFVGLVWLMFYFNRQFYTPRDESTERKKEIQQLRDSDQAALRTYGKSATAGLYRIPIDKAVQKLIADRNKQNTEAPK